MSIDLRLEMKKEYLYVQMTGVFTIEEAKGSFCKILEAASDNDAPKALLNCLQLEGAPSMIERFTYGAFVAKELRLYSIRFGRPSIKLACVAREPLLDKERFGEIVATNRGANVKMFDDEKDALNWLRSLF